MSSATSGEAVAIDGAGLKRHSSLVGKAVLDVFARTLSTSKLKSLGKYLSAISWKKRNPSVCVWSYVLPSGPYRGIIVKPVLCVMYIFEDIRL